jgi:tRNA(Ile)-lysidine synthase
MQQESKGRPSGAREPRAVAHVHREVAGRLRALLPGARGLLLAVSGGPDSVCLLAASAAVASRQGLRLEVAWVDHGLRPESAGEGRLVERLAAEHGLPFHATAVHVGHAPGLEARARQARERALEAVRDARGLDAIATGHTASDQAETLLMRLARGSSLKGAAGVLARKGLLVRPLLGLTRAQVEAYLAARGLGAAQDPMNADPAFLRVRVRTRVLPALEQAAGPGVAGRLARFAQFAAEDSAFLEGQAGAARERLSLGAGALDAVGLRALPPPLQRRVLAALLEEAGLPVDAPALLAALDALARGGRTGLGGGWLLESAGGRVRLRPPAPPTRGAPPAGPLPGPLLLEASPGGPPVHTPAGWRVGWGRAVGGAAGEAGGRAPAGALRLPLPPGVAGPLRVRTRRRGERVRREGGPPRALQDVLVDARVPREARDALPVVEDATGRVLWVPGAFEALRGQGGGELWALQAWPASSGGGAAL